MINIKEIMNESELNSFLSNDSDKLHIIKFSASWCGPCKALESTIKSLDENKINGTLFGEINVDEEEVEDIVAKYNIRNIPVMIFVKNGKDVKKTVGSMNANDLYNAINEANQ